MNVLIAEDDNVSRLVLQRAVERLGHHPHCTADGAHAWQLLQTADIDVVISDWMMPEMDGIDLCRRVRAHAGADTYLYFIFLTALEDRSHFLRAMEVGADDFLTKPLDRAELEIRLRVAERVTALSREVARQRQELERLNRQWFEQARRDPLTGLGNRLLLQEELEVLNGRVQRYQHTYAVLLFDVDHFKRYNDRYGHPAGDEVLRAVAHSIEACCRRGDVAFRYGGEEFLVILPEQSLASASLAAERLRAAIQALGIPHEENHPAGVVTISIGIAVMRQGAQQSMAAGVQQADAALYRAKQAGRNRVVAYAPTDPAADVAG
jgi:diguanylate cyclase (GGDEF)-like protein